MFGDQQRAQALRIRITSISITDPTQSLRDRSVNVSFNQYIGFCEFELLPYSALAVNVYSNFSSKSFRLKSADCPIASTDTPNLLI
jgi:hypothetical protein